MTEEQIQKKLLWIKKNITKQKNEEFKITKFELPGPAVFSITIKLWKYIIWHENVRISFF